MLEMDDTALQSAWWVLNDIYRSSDLVLLYPPHVLALAAIYLSFAMHPPVEKPIAVPSPAVEAIKLPPRPADASPQQPPPFVTSSTAAQPPAQQPSPMSRTPSGPLCGGTDPVAFLASANVSLPLVLEVVQQIVSLYSLWRSYNSTGVGDGRSPMNASSPLPGSSPVAQPTRKCTPAEEMVASCLTRIREERASDLAHPASAGR